MIVRRHWTPRPARYSCAMRPLRYSINVTLDRCCDHRAIPADEDLKVECGLRGNFRSRISSPISATATDRPISACHASVLRSRSLSKTRSPTPPRSLSSPHTAPLQSPSPPSSPAWLRPGLPPGTNPGSLCGASQVPLGNPWQTALRRSAHSWSRAGSCRA